ncbi:MAG TPA: DUF6434 domain-containing protein [Metabacillus sp.]|nr:DUF6434 domain-containing protein [Metabacillus sp.]
MRPKLMKEMSVQSFKNFYWLKTELQQFCRENGISPSGSKIEISDRIEVYLQTGEVKEPLRKINSKKKTQETSELNLDTVISENHRCSQQVRAFFKTIIPNFHFSTYIQDFIKQNVGKTYHDVVEAWYKEEIRKKDPSYKKNIAPQFEYNQFIRDFFDDPINKGKPRHTAIEEWNKIKKLPGSNKYNRLDTN